MADDANDKILLTPSNIVGIMQRSLLELNAYLGQAPQNIDLNAVMNALNDIATWVNRMPAPNTYMPPDATGAEKRAAN